MARVRFIAGATCPACGATDKTFVQTGDSGEIKRGCRACDFEEKLDEIASDPSVQRLKLPD